MSKCLSKKLAHFCGLVGLQWGHSAGGEEVWVKEEESAWGEEGLRRESVGGQDGIAWGPGWDSMGAETGEHGDWEGRAWGTEEGREWGTEEGRAWGEKGLSPGTICR